MGSEMCIRDRSTPYSADNNFFTGYAHVNLSGVGCPEMGSLLLMPTSGELNVDYHEYGSEYKNEVAHPGYYSNILTKYNIKTEATASRQPEFPQAQSGPSLQTVMCPSSPLVPLLP